MAERKTHASPSVTGERRIHPAEPDFHLPAPKAPGGRRLRGSTNLTTGDAENGERGGRLVWRPPCCRPARPRIRPRPGSSKTGRKTQLVMRAKGGEVTTTAPLPPPAVPREGGRAARLISDPAAPTLEDNGSPKSKPGPKTFSERRGPARVSPMGRRTSFCLLPGGEEPLGSPMSGAPGSPHHPGSDGGQPHRSFPVYRSTRQGRRSGFFPIS